MYCCPRELCKKRVLDAIQSQLLVTQNCASLERLSRRLRWDTSDDSYIGVVVVEDFGNCPSLKKLVQTTKVEHFYPQQAREHEYVLYAIT